MLLLGLSRVLLENFLSLFQRVPHRGLRENSPRGDSPFVSWTKVAKQEGGGEGREWSYVVITIWSIRRIKARSEGTIWRRRMDE